MSIRSTPDTLLIVLSPASSSHPVMENAHRIVVKLGSSLITNAGEGLNTAAISQWVAQIAALHAQGRQMVLVSSGAIAEGLVRLGWPRRPRVMHKLQAAAAVGQMGLIQAYEKAFASYGIRTAQILLTHEDLSDRHRYLNARSTLNTLIELGVIPIVNENDTVVTDEIRLGDNDTLGALVTNLIEADCLIILTDQQGLFNADPRHHPQAELITAASAGDPALERMAGGAGSDIGTGGMLTKVLAAQRAANSGGHTVIASGHEHNVLSRLAAGEPIGTTLYATLPIRSARQRWLANQLRVRGRLVLDAGAIRALTEKHKSLLPVGVTKVEGEFGRGDVVACLDSDGVEHARGLINYGSSDARRIIGHHSDDIAAILGRDMSDQELMHRDNLVLVSAV